MQQKLLQSNFTNIKENQEKKGDSHQETISIGALQLQNKISDKKK